MPDVANQISDDQIALAVCLGAVVVAGLIMYFSIHIGRLTGRIPAADDALRGDLLTTSGRPEEIKVRERAA